MTDDDLRNRAKGKSREARRLRKQLELYSLCSTAHKTDMNTYLSVLLVLMENLHAEKRFWFFVIRFTTNLYKLWIIEFWKTKCSTNIIDENFKNFLKSSKIFIIKFWTSYSFFKIQYFTTHKDLLKNLKNRFKFLDS
jgi:flagellar biosynthesis protein FlhB